MNRNDDPMIWFIVRKTTIYECTYSPRIMNESTGNGLENRQLCFELLIIITSIHHLHHGRTIYENQEKKG